MDYELCPTCRQPFKKGQPLFDHMRHCGGSINKKCEKCWGKGIIIVSVGPNYTCPVCKGAGFLKG